MQRPHVCSAGERMRRARAISCSGRWGVFGFFTVWVEHKFLCSTQWLESFESLHKKRFIHIRSVSRSVTYLQVMIHSKDSLKSPSRLRPTQRIVTIYWIVSFMHTDLKFIPFAKNIQLIKIRVSVWWERTRVIYSVSRFVQNTESFTTDTEPDSDSHISWQNERESKSLHGGFKKIGMIVPTTRLYIMFWTFGVLILAILCLGICKYDL